MADIDFKVMGLDSNTSDFLNWCMMYRTNLEKAKLEKVMEIWQQEDEEGNAILSFNKNGVLLRVGKNLFS